MTNPLFGIRAAQIAPWTATGSYGTAVDIYSINSSDFKEITVDGELRGNDAITDLASFAIGGEINLGFAFKQYQLIETLTGVTSFSYANSGRITRVGSEVRPYFGLALQIYQSNGTGSAQIFIPKAKLVGGLSYQAKFGEYVVPTANIKFLPDGVQKLYSFVNYEASTPDIAFPPTNPS